MQLSRKWLSEFVDITATDKQYADDMTDSGSKVEGTIHPGEEITNVVVGLVKEMWHHPDSDHLWVTMIDVGGEEPIQIVTGAQNVNVGDLVPVALHNSTLPGGVKIKKGKLRGVESNGMLCSLGELGLDTHDFPYAIEDGIFIIKEDCKPGDDIKPICGLDDAIVEFEITNNRPDCFSVIGLARETAATYDVPLKLHTPVVKGCGGDINEHLSVTVEDAELCPRYTARIVKNIKVEPSPKWLRERIRAMGMRPINNIVDITNYVMMEYGQPMHAFDHACLEGGQLIVRAARAGETIDTLDGEPRQLDESMIVIADAVKPCCIAGVKGGANSEITENTKFVVFESANFNGTSVRRTGLRLGLRTDSSSRFEKGLDPENTMPALQRACELVELLGAGEVIDGVIDVYAGKKAPTVLPLAPEKINALLGTDIDEAFMVNTLTRLGFTVENGMVTVPSWRGDVERNADLAEEVARFYGYNDIVPTMIRAEATMGGYSAKQQAEKDIHELCRRLGFSEIYSYSFVSPTSMDKVRLLKDSALRKVTTILNPLGEDTSIMRTLSLPSMLTNLSRNKAFRNQQVKLYELAKVYRDCGEELPDERVIVTLGSYGCGDFYAMKGAVETILNAMRIYDVSYEADRTNPAYHPGRCALIKQGETVIGVVGQIHPEVEAEYDLDETYAAELDFAALMSQQAPESGYKPLPRFPGVQRDIAVVCDNAVTAAAVQNCIKSAGGKLLRDVKLFDIYTGVHIPEGKKSLAFSLTLRSDEGTLTDSVADETTKNILSKLESELGAVLR